MDNQTDVNIPPTQPLSHASMTYPKNWFRILLFIISGLIVIAVSVLVGIQIGINQMIDQQRVDEEPPTLSGGIKIMPTAAVPSPTAYRVMVDWETYIREEGKYEIRFPSGWVVDTYNHKYPNNKSGDKAYIVFQSRATTDKEKAEDAPGLRLDMGVGSIKITTTDPFRGQKYAQISGEDFFNPKSDFWLTGNVTGGAPGTTYSIPEETSVGGKRAMKQTSHPTYTYEWNSPNQITTNYYVWLGNSANEVVEVSFIFDDKNPDKQALIDGFNQALSTFRLIN